jgi:hypothetical protein
MPVRFFFSRGEDPVQLGTEGRGKGFKSAERRRQQRRVEGREAPVAQTVATVAN